MRTHVRRPISACARSCLNVRTYEREWVYVHVCGATLVLAWC